MKKILSFAFALLLLLMTFASIAVASDPACGSADHYYSVTCWRYTLLFHTDGHCRATCRLRWRP